MLSKLGLYHRTIKHLKPIQIQYRLWFMLRSRFRQITGHSYPLFIPKKGNKLNLEPGLPKPATCNLQPATPFVSFTFLNQSHTFGEEIDWNSSEYGKLWSYNLNYFEYLLQPGMTREEGLKLIRTFIDQIEDNREGLEPYPVSLRGINWIKFLSRYEIQDSAIDASLYAQYQILLDNLEYHVDGNHLMENGCSLLLGACYFWDEHLWKKARQLIIKELEEEILDDGGHYERSVMYHVIVIERLLDSYNLLSNNSCFPDQGGLEQTLAANLQKMLCWLKEMQWDNGDLPEVNDHVAEMVPPVSELYNYAGRLGLQPADAELTDSGYRKYKYPYYEFLADVGDIGPDYVLGHAHSDIFSFLLRINGREIITDTGTSTYENNRRRQVERSTSAHNTVMVEGEEQNEVWSAFRVGRRGHVDILSENGNKITARHDGYQFMNIIHERQFEFERHEITICDLLKGSKDEKTGTFYLHFSPGIEVNRSGNAIGGDAFRISFVGHSSIDLGSYKKAIGYNKCQNAVRASIAFQDKLTTKFRIHST